MQKRCYNGTENKIKGGFMKKFTSLILVLLMAAVLISGCTHTPDPPADTTFSDTMSSSAPETTETTAASETTAEELTTPPPETTACVHRYEKTVVTPADKEHEGLAEFVCALCGDSYTEVLPKIKSIKILAIGNSFSSDTMEYLYFIFREAGYTEIVLGNLYIGSCSLDMHWDNIKSGAGAYIYYKNNSGVWAQNKDKSLSFGLLDEDWDFITLQQKGNDSGNPSSYGNLGNIVSYLTKNKTNQDAKIYWHMTWAYHPDMFPGRYGATQAGMYQSIVSTVQNVILKNQGIDGVIPCGTVVQNLRSSYVGEALTRDGFHLSYDYGRYSTALCWFTVLTGESIDELDWVPGNRKFLAEHFAVIREAVNNAVKTPYAVTQSSYKTKP